MQAPSDRLKLLNARRPVNPEQVLNTQQGQSNSYQSTSYSQVTPAQQQYGPVVSQQYQSQPSYNQAPAQQYAQTTQATYTTPRAVYAGQPSYSTPAAPQYQSQPSYTTSVSQLYSQQVYTRSSAPVYQQPQI